MPQVRTLPCLHTFHSGCAEEWLKKKKVCPLCNFPIDGTAEQGAAQAAEVVQVLLAETEPRVLAVQAELAQETQRQQIRAVAVAVQVARWFRQAAAQAVQALFM